MQSMTANMETYDPLITLLSTSL